MTWPQLIAG